MCILTVSMTWCVAGTSAKSASPQPPAQTQGDKYLRPQDVKRGWVLSLFIIINVITVFSALSVAAAEVLSIIYHDLTCKPSPYGGG